MNSNTDSKTKDQSHQDLFFGLLAPIGTDKNSVANYLTKTLVENFGYKVEALKLSDYIKSKFPEEFPDADKSKQCYFCEMRSKILCGTQLRKSVGDPAILAKMAVSEIRNMPTKRPDFVSRSDGSRRAFIFDQLKRREEIDYLSNIYGKSFFLIGVHAPTDMRLRRLSRQINKPESFAQELMELDQSEKEYYRSMSACPQCRSISEEHSPMGGKDGKDDFGQQLREIYCEADVFISDQDYEREMLRFLDLIFGSPREFPSSSEHAMFLAFSAATRSADLSRQVGAAILNKNGDLISVGSNDVPKAGGGIYDYRNHKNDLALGFEANTKRINEIATNVVQTLSTKKLLETDETTKNKVMDALLNDSELGSLTEFHRTVHAEMQAIMAAARSGVSPKEGSIFVTTFPCHNCAKHIVSAGILDVYFVEPYPKSQAERLHQDALMMVEDGSKILDKVAVRPYLGVGPRRFNDLFSLNLSTGSDVKRKAGFSAKSYNRHAAIMRFQSVVSPMDVERSAEKIFLEELKEKLADIKIKLGQQENKDLARSAKLLESFFSQSG